MNTIKTWEERKAEYLKKYPKATVSIEMFMKDELDDYRQAARATPAQPVPPQSSVGVAIRALQVGTSGSKGYVKAFCHGAVVMRDAAAELAEQAQGPQDDYEFERGVIACLGVLKAHGYPHGSVIHDEIVEAADPSRIYAAAEDEDYEWAGLDPSRKPGAPSIAQDGQKSETDHG